MATFQRPDGRAPRSVPPSTSVHAVTHCGEQAGMRRGVAYRGPSGWVLTRLTCVFLLNRVVLVDRGGSSILLRARQHRAGNHAEDRLQDVEPGMGSARGTPPPSWRCRAALPPAPEGNAVTARRRQQPALRRFRTLEPGQHSGGQPIGSAPSQGVTVPVINAVPISPPERHDRL
jgi:hypothetical protein